MHTREAQFWLVDVGLILVTLRGGCSDALLNLMLNKTADIVDLETGCPVLQLYFPVIKALLSWFKILFT